MTVAAAVIVVDLQTGMFDGVLEPPIYAAEGVARRTRTVLDWARRSGRPVAFVRHDGPKGDPLAPGEPGWPVWPELGQAPDEPTFSKSVGDAFSNPALGDWVGASGADRVILLGAQTNACIAASVAGAMAKGLGVTVVADAHSTTDFNGEAAADIIARHNRLFAEAGATLKTTAELTGG